MIGFCRWLKFRLLLAAVTHKTGGPGSVGPGEDLTVEVLDHFNHVPGPSFSFCVLCEIRWFVTKRAFHSQASVEGTHDGTQICCLLHLQNLEIGGRMVKSGPSPATFFTGPLLGRDTQTHEQKKENDQWCEL